MDQGWNNRPGLPFNGQNNYNYTPKNQQQHHVGGGRTEQYPHYQHPTLQTNSPLNPRTGNVLPHIREALGDDARHLRPRSAQAPFQLPYQVPLPPIGQALREVGEPAFRAAPPPTFSSGPPPTAGGPPQPTEQFQGQRNPAFNGSAPTYTGREGIQSITRAPGSSVPAQYGQGMPGPSGPPQQVQAPSISRNLAPALAPMAPQNPPGQPGLSGEYNFFIVTRNQGNTFSAYEEKAMILDQKLRAKGYTISSVTCARPEADFDKKIMRFHETRASRGWLLTMPQSEFCRLVAQELGHGRTLENSTVVLKGVVVIADRRNFEQRVFAPIFGLELSERILDQARPVDVRVFREQRNSDMGRVMEEYHNTRPFTVLDQQYQYHVNLQQNTVLVSFENKLLLNFNVDSARQILRAAQAGNVAPPTQSWPRPPGPQQSQLYRQI